MTAKLGKMQYCRCWDAISSLVNHGGRAHCRGYNENVSIREQHQGAEHSFVESSKVTC